MVGLPAALGDYGVAALLKRLGQQEFELAGLVAAAGQPSAVVALDPQLDAQFLGFILKGDVLKAIGLDRPIQIIPKILGEHREGADFL